MHEGSPVYGLAAGGCGGGSFGGGMAQAKGGSAEP